MVMLWSFGNDSRRQIALVENFPSAPAKVFQHRDDRKQGRGWHPGLSRRYVGYAVNRPPGGGTDRLRIGGSMLGCRNCIGLRGAL
jgi:hypothetical protein